MRAARQVEPSSSISQAAHTTLMASAFRRPTFSKRPGDRAPGERDQHVRDDLARPERGRAVADEELGERQFPCGRAAPASRTRASAASSAGAVSADGDAVTRLPPTVARLRTSGLPTDAAAAASTGT